MGREPAEDVRHEGRRLLMTGQDEADGTVPEGVHELQVFLAGDPESETDPLVFET